MKYFCLFIIVALVCSCSKEEICDICGIYKVEKSIHTFHDPEEINNVFIHFDGNGQYSITNDGKLSTGTYKINKNYIVFSHEVQQTRGIPFGFACRTYRIIEIKSNKLVLRYEEFKPNGVQKEMFQYHLVKI